MRVFPEACALARSLRAATPIAPSPSAAIPPASKFRRSGLAGAAGGSQLQQHKSPARLELASILFLAGFVICGRPCGGSIITRVARECSEAEKLCPPSVTRRKRRSKARRRNQ